VLMSHSELVPVPDPLALPEEPTPQDYGFPDKPTATQLQSWMRQQLWLEAFAACGSIGEACADTGIPVPTAEHWDTVDSYGFKKRKGWAAQMALGKLEKEINRRGVEGIDHPVIHQGVITDTYKQYSDNLLMFRAKRLDPEYRDNHQPSVDLGAREALEAMTRAVVQFNQTNVQININQSESGSEEKPAAGASIIDMIQNPATSPE